MKPPVVCRGLSLFSPNDTILEASEPDLSLSMDLPPTYPTGSGLLGNPHSPGPIAQASLLPSFGLAGGIDL
jgi:hypothetical protein